ncbi:hypothetical protein [Dickeya dianthicola]|uniref:hypothetical protein n=1 Tax=Dickeya dianthicola TaxID=204039 RepID=UPI001268704C|nr:hypothetical protein [Dickeya dianthicola]MCI4031508.1 hypothetical protein [Dickeya dianthicola]MCI4174566.1 hypothetical protein [Dickeya dianthicola]MCI4179574.1 hypothetical protein [Dickeya dianthicola]MCI4180319.1 hypothetical protein [Dickeya dianthicola]MCI4194082.1 hypothetical protein [Dickeya dianthicola]
MNTTNISNIFLRTPYEPGVALREDVFNEQFVAVVAGSAEYPEDDPTYGSYYRDKTLYVSYGATISSVIERLLVIAMNDNWPLRDDDIDYYDEHLGHDCGPKNFYPKQIRILDRFGKLVLGGVFAGDSIKWTDPVRNDADSSKLHARCEEITDEAAIEASWDNYSTAERMRDSARTMLLADVDRRWRQHPEVLSIL